MSEDRVNRTLADRRSIDVDAAHPCLGSERHELRIQRCHLAPAQPVFVLDQDHNRAAFRRLVGERGELRRIGQLCLVDPGDREQLRGDPVSQSDGSGLVEQQRVDIARRLDRTTRHRQDVELDEPVHAGNADCRQQRADRRRDQCHKERDQHDDTDLPARVVGEARDRDGRQQEDDRQPCEQDVECDLVRRLLPLGALNQANHAIEKGRTLAGRDPHLDLPAPTRR